MAHEGNSLAGLWSLPCCVYYPINIYCRFVSFFYVDYFPLCTAAATTADLKPAARARTAKGMCFIIPACKNSLGY